MVYRILFNITVRHAVRYIILYINYHIIVVLLCINRSICTDPGDTIYRVTTVIPSNDLYFTHRSTDDPQTNVLLTRASLEILTSLASNIEKSARTV